MTYTLGLATMDNSAAALFKEGTLVAAIEEERLSRVKNDGSFPNLAIRECLRIEGIAPDQIDHIAVYWQPWRVGTRAFGVFRKLLSSPMARRSILSRTKHMMSLDTDTSEERTPGTWRDLFRIKKILAGEFGTDLPAITFHDHHLCHQIYAEQVRAWDQKILLSYDGGGEADSTVVTVKTSKGHKRLSRHKWPNSLGHYYSFFTGYLGFKMLEGEYKLMGLAPYGKPIYADLIEKEILRLEPEGRYVLNTRLADYHSALRGKFDPALRNMFGPARKPDETPSENHMNLAASVQKTYENALIHLLEPARKAHPDLGRLMISGGCALNVTANGRLLSEGIFDEVMIPPAPHDAGCAIGAAAAALVNQGVPLIRQSIRSPYLGATYASDDVQEQLNRECSSVPDALSQEAMIDETATMLAQGHIVAWFQGRSEFGPRALGARSFLASPMDEGIREDLNHKIKKRELFRPFAPSVTAEHASQFFDIGQPSPYMNIVARVRPEVADKIPAVTHVDGTARVHTVSLDDNPLYHALLSRFGKLTGVPVLLNTSFNIQEPIVYSPSDALSTFRASGVDTLVMGNFIIGRERLN